jgi:hypothetical protein
MAGWQINECLVVFAKFGNLNSYHALMFRSPTFGPSDNLTCMVSPRETGSQKRLVHVPFWTM